jgi:phage protein D
VTEVLLADEIVHVESRRRLRRLILRTLGAGAAAVTLAFGWVGIDWWKLRITDPPSAQVQAVKVDELRSRQDAHERRAEAEISNLHATMERVAALQPGVEAIDRRTARTEAKVDHLDEKIDDLAATVRRLEATQRRADSMGAGR